MMPRFLMLVLSLHPSCCLQRGVPMVSSRMKLKRRTKNAVMRATKAGVSGFIVRISWLLSVSLLSCSASALETLYSVKVQGENERRLRRPTMAPSQPVAVYWSSLSSPGL